jgi:hypothetical protein
MEICILDMLENLISETVCRDDDDVVDSWEITQHVIGRAVARGQSLCKHRTASTCWACRGIVACVKHALMVLKLIIRLGWLGDR